MSDRQDAPGPTHHSPADRGDIHPSGGLKAQGTYPIAQPGGVCVGSQMPKREPRPREKNDCQKEK